MKDKLEIKKEFTLDEIVSGLENNHVYFLTEQNMDVFVPSENYRHLYKFNEERKVYEHYLSLRLR